MYRLSFIILILGLAVYLFGQSTHGDDFQVDCLECHQTQGWKPLREDIKFEHPQVNGLLTGRHAQINCMDCHKTLVFKEASAECIACHTDLHQMSVGNDCARCHNMENWLVNNIPELHEQNGFPLLGAHNILACADCHTSGSNLQWTRLGNDCANCHTDDYQATTQPNHISGGFSTDCRACHDPISYEWGGNYSHFFFPLQGGHNLQDCNKCHQENDFFSANSDCISCHQEDFNQTTKPNHNLSGFPKDCAICHNINGWQPAQFKGHDTYFPIYSGKHQNEWENNCASCHINPSNFSAFSCINCHEHSNEAELRDEHDKVSGFRFISSECYRCHPRGEED